MACLPQIIAPLPLTRTGSPPSRVPGLEILFGSQSQEALTKTFCSGLVRGESADKLGTCSPNNPNTLSPGDTTMTTLIRTARNDGPTILFCGLMVACTFFI